MPDQQQIILDYSQAAALVFAHAARLPRSLPTETISIERALGRCLAKSITADRDQPPFDRSTRDGYAVRSGDLQSGGALKIIGQLRAGQPAFTAAVGALETVEIMTGAPIPTGTDAVLMIEHVDVLEGSIRPHAGRSLQPGENVVPAGAEARARGVIIPSGTRLSAMHIGAAVSCGAAKVDLYRQPRVAILATGDELVEPGQPMLPFQIRNSNSYSLAAQVERAGGIPVRLPIAKDTLQDLERSLETAMQADLVLLSGGVSMGKFDFVEQVLTALGADLLFTGVRIQPGKPVVFGSLPGGRDKKYFFGLPGNPVSTMVTFALFAGPMIRALGGEINPQPLFARARLTSPFNHKPGLTRFLPALLQAAWDKAEVTPVSWQGSGDLAATAKSNCFVVIPPDRRALAGGDEVGVLLAY